MPERDTILFVCTANICRSPMAEALMQHALAAEDGPLRSMKVASAGIAAATGERPSMNSVQALRKVGLSLEKHRSQPLTDDLLMTAFAVFCMTESHRNIIQLHFSDVPEHLFLMREFLPESASREIPDPYGMNLDAYEACRDNMVEAIPGLLRFLRDTYRPADGR